LIFYPRFPGAYERKTAHLSWEEHWAYTRLLDVLYMTEKPLPSNKYILFRITNASKRSQKLAVLRVINEFFFLTPLGYSNDRFEEELTKSESRRTKAQKGANSRWKNHAPSNAPSNATGNARRHAIHTHIHTQPEPSALVLGKQKGLPLDRSSNGDHAKVTKELPSQRAKKQPPFSPQKQPQETPEERLEKMEKSGKYSAEEIETLRKANKRDKAIREGWETKWN
jgi:uncharacterized protein YdaU (DUF1376 family)